MSEINVSNIKTLEERVFLIHAIVDRGYLCYKNPKLPNTIDIYITADAQEELSDFDFFYDNIAYNLLYDFHYLDKNRRGELFVQWRRELDNEVYQTLYDDFTKGVRADNASCDSAEPFCTGTGLYDFPAGVNSGSPCGNVYNASCYEPYYCPQSTYSHPGQDNCLSTAPNPAFYFLRIDQSGTLNIEMYSTPAVDIDFDCWGPFSDMNTACSQLSCYNIVDCSYSTAATETCHIPNAQLGQYYVLLITNYSNSTCNISFQATASSTATTDCTLLPPMVDNDGPYCVGDTIHLTANTTVNANYSWMGPNGYTSNLQNPTIPNCTMAMAGRYKCTITLGNQSNYANTEVAIYPNPTANFTATTVCQGTATQFTSTSTTNPSGQSISSYQWDFGDGQTGSGQNTTHVYATPGTYQATLTVSTGNGHCTDQITHTVTVNPQPTAGFSATTACLGEATQFTNTSTGQSIISTQWNFGDGQGSTVQNPTHTYAQAGTYNVTLTVQAQGGCTSQITQTITVNPQPTAGFTATTVCQGEATQFISTSTGQSIVSYQWNFGDGQTGSGQNVSHTFAQAGTYNVTLTVQAQGGCTSQITQTVTVNPTLEVTIEVDGNTAICDGDTVTLNAVVEFSYVAVGDILCTDGTFVKQDAWPVQGKTAKAVVFYVDDTKAHGWAVSLTQTSNKAWSTLTNMVIATHPNWRDAITDFNGYSNTQTLRNGTSATTYPAAWAVDFSNGWYLPAAGQLNMLYGELPEVNRSLNLITGATPIVDNNPGTTRPGGSVLLWSSTEGSQASEAMAVEIADGCVAKVNKTSSDKYYVRAVISF